jgi:hypothetical protein
VTAQPTRPARLLTRWAALVAVAVVTLVSMAAATPAQADHPDPTFQPLNPVMVLNADLSLGVTWDAPEREATTPATGYTLVLAENPTNRQWWVNVGPDVRSHTWDAAELVPGRSYDTAIWANNEQHLTVAVQTNRVLMPGGATAPSAPTNPSATQTDQGSVTVTWDAPSDDGGEPVSGYQVDTEGANNGSVSASTHSMVVGGLAPGTYEFGIVAENSVGTSTRATATVTVTETVAGAPGRVRDMTAVQTGPGQVTIRWVDPADAGSSPVSSYDAGWGTCCYGNGDRLPATARSVVFNDLILGTEYTLSVAAMNAAGTGPWERRQVTIAAWNPPSTAQPVDAVPSDAVPNSAGAAGVSDVQPAVTSRLANTGPALGSVAVLGLLMFLAGIALMTSCRPEARTVR